MLNQPEPTLTLPEKLQQAIENGQNKVTILENEAKRLSRLAMQFKTEISNDQLYLEDLKKQIDLLAKEKEELLADIDKLDTEKKATKSELLATRDEIKAERVNIAKERKKLSIEQINSKERSENIDERERKVKLAEDKFKKDLLLFENKKVKLQEALK